METKMYKFGRFEYNEGDTFIVYDENDKVVLKVEKDFTYHFNKVNDLNVYRNKFIYHIYMSYSIEKAPHFTLNLAALYDEYSFSKMQSIELFYYDESQLSRIRHCLSELMVFFARNARYYGTPEMVSSRKMDTLRTYNLGKKYPIVDFSGDEDVNVLNNEIPRCCPTLSISDVRKYFFQDENGASIAEANHEIITVLDCNVVKFVRRPDQIEKVRCVYIPNTDGLYVIRVYLKISEGQRASACDICIVTHEFLHDKRSELESLFCDVMKTDWDNPLSNIIDPDDEVCDSQDEDKCYPPNEVDEKALALQPQLKYINRLFKDRRGYGVACGSQEVCLVEDDRLTIFSDGEEVFSRSTAFILAVEFIPYNWKYRMRIYFDRGASIPISHIDCFEMLPSLLEDNDSFFRDMVVNGISCSYYNPEKDGYVGDRNLNHLPTTTKSVNGVTYPCATGVGTYNNSDCFYLEDSLLRNVICAFDDEILFYQEEPFKTIDISSRKMPDDRYQFNISRDDVGSMSIDRNYLEGNFPHRLCLHLGKKYSFAYIVLAFVHDDSLANLTDAVYLFNEQMRVRNQGSSPEDHVKFITDYHRSDGELVFTDELDEVIARICKDGVQSKIGIKVSKDNFYGMINWQNIYNFNITKLEGQSHFSLCVRTTVGDGLGVIGHIHEDLDLTSIVNNLNNDLSTLSAIKAGEPGWFAHPKTEEEEINDDDNSWEDMDARITKDLLEHDIRCVMESFSEYAVQGEKTGLSKKFCDLAGELDKSIANTRFKQLGLEFLLQAKDCFERSVVQSCKSVRRNVDG
jgi:hypothetical protein